MFIQQLTNLTLQNTLDKVNLFVCVIFSFITAFFAFCGFILIGKIYNNSKDFGVIYPGV